MFAYEQAFLCLAYHPDIWFEAANFLNKESQEYLKVNKETDAKRLINETENLYERAINTFMKDNTLIYFAYADFQEVIFLIR
jgi:cleavage stimulation factor subunit 3